ncbi:MAG: hypothetical protein ACOCUW_00395 [Gemmatimonadota bacterium]
MLSWMIAGGVLAGGFLVAYGTMTEQISGRSLLYTAGGLYLFGSLIGAVLGGALGMFGRPVETAARRAFHDQLVALLYALPALFLAFVLTGWIAMTVVAIYRGEVLPLVGVSIAYLAGFAAVGVAIRFGWFGARRAWERFSQHAGRARRLRLMWVEDEESATGDAGDRDAAGDRSSTRDRGATGR